MEISNSYQTYSAASMQPNSMTRRASLTSDQKETLSNILSNYDASNMSEEDEKNLFESMMSADIPMSEESADIMETEGFTAPEKPQGSPPPQPPQSSDQSSPFAALDEDTKNTLLSLVDQYLSGEIDGEAFKEATGSLDLEDTVGNLLRAIA